MELAVLSPLASWKVSSQQLQSTWRKYPALSHCAKPASHPTSFFPEEWIPLTAKHIVVDEAFPLNKAGPLAETTTWQLPQTLGISFSLAANSWHVPGLLVTICVEMSWRTHTLPTLTLKLKLLWKVALL